MGEILSVRLGMPRWRVTRWMRAGWLILLLYGMAQMLIAAVHLHRVPMYTSIYLLVMLVLALLSGLVFRDRAYYCRTLCPVGLLLKVYGRGGMLAVRPGEPDHKADPQIARACKSRLSPLRLHRAQGEDCLMCLDCVQADGEKGRMQLHLRRPWTRQDRAGR